MPLQDVQDTGTANTIACRAHWLGPKSAVHRTGGAVLARSAATYSNGSAICKHEVERGAHAAEGREAPAARCQEVVYLKYTVTPAAEQHEPVLVAESHVSGAGVEGGEVDGVEAGGDVRQDIGVVGDGIERRDVNPRMHRPAAGSPCATRPARRRSKRL